MKVIQVNSLGFNLNKSVAESNDEYDQLAGRVNGACEDASASTLYRGTFPIFRDEFLSKVAEDTGIERKTKETDRKDSDGNPVMVYDETEGAYWKRVIAEKFDGNQEAAVAEYSALAQECMDAAPFDPSVKERKAAGPKSVAKTYVKIATEAVNTGKGEALAGLLSQKLGRDVAITGDAEADIKTLAKAIADNEAAKREQLKAEYAV